MLELEADKYLTHVTLTSSNPPQSPKPVNIFAGLFFNCSPSLLFSMLAFKVELFSGTSSNVTLFSLSSLRIVPKKIPFQFQCDRDYVTSPSLLSASI